jgi:GNAT superfamily N-acetyltransferase
MQIVPMRLRHLGRTARVFHEAPFRLSPREVADLLLTREGIWIATEGDEVLGLAIAALFEEQGGVWIDFVATRESARRRGVATLLIAELEQVARANGFESLSLSVRHGNDSAAELYRRLGFRPAARQTADDRTCLTLELTPSGRARDERPFRLRPVSLATKALLTAYVLASLRREPVLSRGEARA